MVNSEITQEELKEFWEQCGFLVQKCKSRYCGYANKDHYHIYNPVSSLQKHPDYGEENDYPKITLDNLFKYAVPKLEGMLLTTDCGKYRAEASLHGTYYEYDTKPEVALLRAIQEAFKAKYLGKG